MSETQTCRPTRTLAEVEEIIARETAVKGGGDTHPMRSWWHCAVCRVWHKPQDFPAPMPEAE